MVRPERRSRAYRAATERASDRAIVRRRRAEHRRQLWRSATMPETRRQPGRAAPRRKSDTIGW